ncbi:hypothetical protein N7501_005244 [Penicillium viridicatum]|nr:hypothetical protein N7501_005244 [Penicillium viridicatum]
MTLVAIGACYLDKILTCLHLESGVHIPWAEPPITQVKMSSVVRPKSVAGAAETAQTLSKFSANCYNIGLSQVTGSRTIVNYNDLPEMTRIEFATAIKPLRAVTYRPWFHFENVSIISREHFPEAEISVEVEKPGRSGLQELADAADVVIYSKGWAQNNGYISAEECLRDQSLKTSRATLLCCTWGHDGAAALEPKTCKFAHVPAHTEEVGIADTIGAGDTFNAGLLYGLVYRSHDWDFRKRLEFANLIAGLKVTQEGFADLQRALNFPSY